MFLPPVVFLVAVLCLVSTSSARDILVLVGAGQQLAFSPTNITAAVGDTIQFQFQSKNHSVTQSTFANPCQVQTSPSLGIDSGFQFVAAGSTELPQWSFTLQDIVPLWFFCAQTNPANHCQRGMVFSLNANEEGSESTAAFQARAIASGDGSSSSSAASSSSVASSSAIQTSSASPTSSPIPSNASSPDTGSHLTSVKKKNVAGPIAGGVVGGLLLLAILAFLVYWARRRRHRTARTAIVRGIDGTPPPVRREAEPKPVQLFSVLPTGETQLSPPPVTIPRGLVVEEEKARFAATQQMSVIQQEISQLRAQAQARESTPESFEGQSTSTNAQLLDAIRMLGGQMHSLEQQMQAIGQARADEPPRYTAGS